MGDLNVVRVSQFATREIYEVTFYESLIVTTVTAEIGVADEWVNGITDSIVSISVKYCRATSLPSIIQICNGDRCLIFQIQICGFVPSSIQFLINNPSNTIVGVTIQAIIEILQARFGLVKNPALKTFDLRDLLPEATKKWRTNKFSDRVLQRWYEIPKNVNRRWGKAHLSRKRVMFAAIDSYAAYLVASLLMV